ncbi:MAG: 3-hydroxybutyryl-CoA dehydrogenase [Rhodocyclaceae bacterium]|nr:3-hydroxybutyryl-CoA dehydrogenase [Rhodocyclaceae bacterium]MBX3670549.1 3-hydroxybutyryl-CoA dehydrogenase [Rhodocyclaceae bacterium]
MDIKKVGVVGAGTMGNGIAQVFAVAGFEVLLTDISAAALERATNTISGSLDRLIKKDKMTADQKAAAMARISATTEFGALADADLLVEAALENEEFKVKLFGQLDGIAKPEAILASNTSSISISRIAAATKRPEKVIGMHFFNPVPLLELVELVNGLRTAPETYASLEAVVRAIGKSPVKVRNSPGFVVNRMLCPMINEAVFVLAEGVASAEEIDAAMKLGANHPIGPLALCDLIGLDVQLAVMNVLHHSLRESKYRPAPLLVEMVEAGYLGRKTKRGFYSYD